MTRHGSAATGAVIVSFVALCGYLVSAQDVAPQPPANVQVPASLRARADRDGHVRAIVELRLASGNHVPERALPPQALEAQRRAIEQAAARVIQRLPAANHRVIRQYRTVPYIAVEVTPAALAALEGSSDVVRVMEDGLLKPVLADSAPLVQSDQAWDSGYDGTGTVIAVLDTGVEANHPFLAGKVVQEACFSSTVQGLSQSYCPNGQEEQVGAGSAAPCSFGDCLHGTHVAGIAAGNGGQAGQAFSGVARGAQLVAVQVFSEIVDAESCGGIAPCAAAFESDVIAGLEHAYSLAGSLNLVAVNMSLGGSLYTTACDDAPFKPAIDNLRSAGIASVVSSGNSGSPWSIATPACVSSAVSVGSTDKSDHVSWYSNVAPMLSLFAPGEAITSSVLNGAYNGISGTSMAAPHVAGAWAILRQAKPSGSVSSLLAALQSTGLPVTDNRFFGTTTKPRIRVFQALAALVPVTNPAPVATAVSPDHVRAGLGSATVTITGSGFNAFSVVLWNGAPQPSTVLKVNTIRAAIPDSLLAVHGDAQVAVFTPGPGGGTSAAVTVTIDPPPSLTVSATAASSGTPVTVTLNHGLGNPGDWLAFASTSSSNTQYSQWTYVGTGVTTRTWTVTMPSTAGTYEFRLFLSNGFTRAATSPAVTVTTPPNPVPAISSLSPASGVAGGQAFTLTVTGSGFVSSSVVRWNGANRPTTFINSTQVRAAISAADIASTGSVDVTVFSPAPGGGVSSPKTFAIGQAPVISVSATTTTTGGTITATLTDGFGGAGDWLALAATGAANTSYVKYIYVGAGVTTKAWTVQMPVTPGTYEFRYFPNNGFTRAATSPAVTVTQGANPVPALSSLSPSKGFVGSGGFTLTVNGSGFASASVVRWNGADRPTTFVSATQLRAAIPASDMVALGTAQVVVFSPAPGGGTSAALPFTIQQAPTLTVSATSVAPGATVSVTLTNGLGGGADWLALAATGAPNTSYLKYIYLGAGTTTRVWTVTMPTTPGTYEFRLFLNNGYTRAATSPTVTVQ